MRDQRTDSKTKQPLPLSATCIPDALDDAGLTVYEYRIYCHLKRRARRGASCFPSVENMAKACGIGLGTAKKALKGLVERHFVKRTPRPGTSTVYVLANEEPRSPDDPGHQTTQVARDTIGGSPDDLGGGSPDDPVKDDTERMTPKVCSPKPPEGAESELGFLVEVDSASAQEPHVEPMDRIKFMLGQRLQTEWKPAQIKKLTKLLPIPEEDLALVEAFHRSTEEERKRGEFTPSPRKGIDTLLNNWHEEIERSRKLAAKIAADSVPKDQGPEGWRVAYQNLEGQSPKEPWGWQNHETKQRIRAELQKAS